MENRSWNNLPEHILVIIFSYLDLGDRYRAAVTCQNWYVIGHAPLLWHKFIFKFGKKSDERYLQYFEKHAGHLRCCEIRVDQQLEPNRLSACKAITAIARSDERRLQKFKILFVGENPLFFSGNEFTSALTELFGPPGSNVKRISDLTEVDLSGLSVSYNEELLYTLCNNNQHLQKLNIQSRAYVCKVSSNCILFVVNKCKSLKDLRLYYSSLSDQVVAALTDDDRDDLDYLSVICGRFAKYSRDIESEAWRKLRLRFPKLRMCLTFDDTCPLHRVSEIMDEEMPVSVLRLETFTDISAEVELGWQYFGATLEKLVVQAPRPRKSSEQLNKALINAAHHCPRLRSCHVFCLLEQATVEKILELHPEMKDRNSYTLKFIPEPHPWIPGNDLY